MRRLLILPIMLFLIGGLLLFERPAYGYVDPGSGLLAIQAVGSALVAAGWYLRRRIYALFHRGGSRRNQAKDYSVTHDDTSSPLS
jgi:hypothetical protein